MRGLLHAIAAFSLAVVPAEGEKLCFPDGFLFGTATAAYQVEGGWNENGRTPSIWDDFCHKNPKTACANVADDFYHRYEDDIKMMKEAGHKIFRFSTSWSRVMNWDPTTKHMKPNPAGIAFYHAVIDALNKNGIAPVLTMYHFDLPLELQDNIKPTGWLAPEIQDHFLEFAELLYHEYGSKVMFWTTFNEPWGFAMAGYSGTTFGVGWPGNPAPSDTNQYIAIHNVLLAHAKAVKRFRELKTQNVIKSDAVISIVTTGDHNMPLDPSNPDDVAAADRAYQFSHGLIMQPIVNGDYPTVMRERVGDRLPKFTPEETALLKGSYDIFNLNHYSTHQVTDCRSTKSHVRCDDLPLGMVRDMGVDNTIKPPGAHNSALDKNGNQICDYFSGYPEGYRGFLRWINALNKTTPILLTENGFCGNDDVEGLDRLWYHQTYLERVQRAIVEDKIPIIGYTAWSLMDNYEWGSYTPRFGLYYVNYTSQVGTKDNWTPKPGDLARVPRLAAKFLSSLAKSGCMETWKEDQHTDQTSTNVPPSSSASQIVATSHNSDAAVHSSSTLWISAVVVVATVAAIAAVFIRRRRSGTPQEQTSLLHA